MTSYKIVPYLICKFIAFVFENENALKYLIKVFVEMIFSERKFINSQLITKNLIVQQDLTTKQ